MAGSAIPTLDSNYIHTPGGFTGNNVCMYQSCIKLQLMQTLLWSNLRLLYFWQSSFWQSFCSIKLPLLFPPITAGVLRVFRVITLMGYWAAFDVPYPNPPSTTSNVFFIMAVTSVLKHTGEKTHAHQERLAWWITLYLWLGQVDLKREKKKSFVLALQTSKSSWRAHACRWFPLQLESHQSIHLCCHFFGLHTYRFLGHQWNCLSLLSALTLDWYMFRVFKCHQSIQAKPSALCVSVCVCLEKALMRRAGWSVKPSLLFSNTK